MLIVSQAALLAKLKSETAAYPELQDYDASSTSTPQNGHLTGASTGTGTPLPPAAASNPQKLKLTFNGGANGRRGD